MKRKEVLILIIAITALIILLIIALNPSTRYNKNIISESKYNSIIEARTESKNLVLEDIEFNDYNLIIDEKNNTLYYSLVNTSKNKYNPSISFSANKNNVRLVILSDEITDEKVKSNYEFKIMIYTDTEYHIYNLKCTEFPILNIRYKENVENNKDKNIPIDIYLFNNLSNTPQRITISNGRLKINEDEFLFSLNQITPGNNIRDNKISILKMKPSHAYILNKANINEENNVDVETNTPPKKQIVELFINSQYKGKYYINPANTGQ